MWNEAYACIQGTFWAITYWLPYEIKKPNKYSLSSLYFFFILYEYYGEDELIFFYLN